MSNHRVTLLITFTADSWEPLPGTNTAEPSVLPQCWRVPVTRIDRGIAYMITHHLALLKRLAE